MKSQTVHTRACILAVDPLLQSAAAQYFVAARGDQLVATLAVGNSKAGKYVKHYRRYSVALINAQTTDPRWRQRGIGGALLAFACRWLGASSYTQLGVKIPMHCAGLLEHYQRRGFKLVDIIQREGELFERGIMIRPIRTGGRASSSYTVQTK